MTTHVHSRMRVAGMAASLGLLLASTACNKPNTHDRLNAPPQGANDRVSRYQSFAAYHTDNAMLHDMCLRDIHFVPNQSALSGTGEARLARYCELLAETGGLINYQFGDAEPELVDARLEAARRFIDERKPGDAAIDIQTGLAAGPRRSAADDSGVRTQGTAGYGARDMKPQPRPGGAAGGNTGGGGAGAGSGNRGGR